MRKIIGLTGPTGSGKSEAAQLAAQRGIKVIDCDLLARKAVMPETSGLSSLVKVFGEDILSPDGSLDRKALAKKAFSDQESTKLLNDTILPHIVKLAKDEMQNDGMYLLDAPTLFESGIDAICDSTVSVIASREEREKRIIGRDKLTIEQARLRINAGKPDLYYVNRCDYTVYNNGDIDAFKSEISKVFDKAFGAFNR